MWFILLDALLFTLVVLLAALRLDPQPVHHEEVKRQAKKGNGDAQAELVWRENLPRLSGIRQVLIITLFIGVTLASVYGFGWLSGSLIAIVLCVEVPALARLPWVQRLSAKAFGRIQPWLIKQLANHRWLEIFTEVRPRPEITLQSREDLIDIIEKSRAAIPADEHRAIAGVLTLRDKKVSEVMTPRSVIDTIGAEETLAPLVVDHLYKTGHSRFPVIDQDIDHVVGVLLLRDAIDMKKPKSAVRDAMDENVFYIAEGQNLEHALHAFIRTRHHLFIVVNAYRETVGVLSLEDVIEALLGRKIRDEFDEFEDLRKVAEQNPRGNNRTGKAEDV